MKENNKNLLEFRNYLKSKKPDFLRQDAHKVKKLEKKWRRPKGRHSKMRFKLRGYRKSPSIGYSSPKEVKYLNKKGLREILVNNINDLMNIDNKELNIVLLSSNLGLRKRLEILRKAKELKLNISNIRDIDSFINNTESFFKEKKKKKEEKKAKKETKKEPEKKETKETKKEEDEEIKRKVLESKKSREK